MVWFVPHQILNLEGLPNLPFLENSTIFTNSSTIHNGYIGTNQVPSPISTSAAMVVNGSMVTSLPILARLSTG